MANTIFEKQGGTYTQVGDYMLPDLLPAEEENVTENLKATDQMLWVRKMNNIRNHATEIVNADIIYKV